MNKVGFAIPSVDEVLRSDGGRHAVARFGHAATLGAVRKAIDDLRSLVRSGAALRGTRSDAAARIADVSLAALAADDVPRLRRVFNLTGTVLHTNLGRAILA